MDSMSSQIRVFVRCKPPSSRNFISLGSKSKSISIDDKAFQFDQVFDEDTSQEHIFLTCAKEIVGNCFQGYNGTIFAYGQTGSGKTHSIIGDLKESIENHGIIPNAINHIFSTISARMAEDKNIKFRVNVSFLEIYNDECRDLLHQEVSPRDIIIREGKDGKIFTSGLRTEVVYTREEALLLLEYGTKFRVKGCTEMNSESSRSHSIYTISMEIISSSDIVGKNTVLVSKLHMVDLAGSERAKRTLAIGNRLKESVGINQGLLSLGKVIRALGVKEDDLNRHVPYRDSKLTRILQDSIGGNSRTVMLACISGLAIDKKETLNTLHYACCARAVQNRAVVNVGIAEGLVLQNDSDTESDLVQSLRSQLLNAQRELNSFKLKATSSSADIDNNSSEGEIKRLQSELEDCRDDLKRDEEIFTNKVRELRRVHKALVVLERENVQLRRLLADSDHRQLRDVTLDVLQEEPTQLEEEENKVTMADTKTPSQINNTIESTIETRIVEKKKENCDLNKPTLDEQMESLMRNISELSGVRDRLAADAELTEKSQLNTNDAIKRQLEQYKARRNAYRNKMRSLRHEIVEKEAIIGKCQQQMQTALEDTTRAKSCQAELEDLKLEHEQLSNRLIVEEAAQVEATQKLEREFRIHHQREEETRFQIKELEKRNIDLATRLQKLNSQRLEGTCDEIISVRPLTAVPLAKTDNVTITTQRRCSLPLVLPINLQSDLEVWKQERRLSTSSTSTAKTGDDDKKLGDQDTHEHIIIANSSREDTLQRWQAERNRREHLERVTGDMFRELRVLREVVSARSSRSDCRHT